jgi:HEAT repeat protein
MQVMAQLVQAGSPEGMRLAEELIASKDAQGATAAVWQLAQSGSADSRRLLERALDSKEPSVKATAISALGQNPDDHAMDTLLRLARDSDASVRSMAIGSLAQVGSERAQQAVLEATRAGKAEERIAAISGLAQMDDARASQQLAQLMRDPDPQVAQTAIQSSYNGGAEVDQSLEQLVNDPGTPDNLRAMAAGQLRQRGTDLDATTEQAVTKLAGPLPEYGGAGYGSYHAEDYLE